MIRAAALFLALPLAACGDDAPRAPRADPGQADPAIAAALAAPLLTDSDLARSANATSLRAPEAPAGAPVPPQAMLAIGEPALIAADAQWPAPPETGEATLAELARPLAPGCDGALGYGASWAMRLPPALALPPQARVAEAAGSEARGCRLRIVRYAAAARPATLAGWYRGHGFAPDGALAGARYRIRIGASPAGGSIVSLVSRLPG